MQRGKKDWRGVGRPQVAMHSQLPRFRVATFSSLGLFVITAPNHIFNQTVDQSKAFNNTDRP